VPERNFHRQRAGHRWSWIVGVALLAGVVLLALNAAQGREFLTRLAHADPAWLAAATLLQALTYVAQGETWRVVARRTGWPLGLSFASGLSLAKLFTDQALPSAGVSGTVLMVQALRARGMPRVARLSGVIVTVVSFHAAYVLCLAAAVGIARVVGLLNPAMLTGAVLWAALEIVISAFGLRWAGRAPGTSSWVARFRFVQPAFRFLAGADPRLVRDGRLLAEATIYQLLIVVLDTLTILALIWSVGGAAPPHLVFGAFVFATLFKNLGVVPGGLGTFEAASVLGLRAVGLSLPVALSATLLFRGLSFWLPMLPGAYLARRLGRRAPPARHQAPSEG
jgi:uncharacterized membrane protein YbhN (UPF0104 family)